MAVEGQETPSNAALSIADVYGKEIGMCKNRKMVDGASSKSEEGILGDRVIIVQWQVA